MDANAAASLVSQPYMFEPPEPDSSSEDSVQPENQQLSSQSATER